LQGVQKVKNFSRIIDEAVSLDEVRLLKIDPSEPWQGAKDKKLFDTALSELDLALHNMQKLLVKKTGGYDDKGNANAQVKSFKRLRDQINNIALKIGK
jgi:hypothetical protein